ncbi:hypothetical protein HWV62_26725 [Athelia sp. TMB]|nr:hypothetical protein HWV62_26725 [Athelia sp. TMB]
MKGAQSNGKLGEDQFEEAGKTYPEKPESDVPSGASIATELEEPSSDAPPLNKSAAKKKAGMPQTKVPAKGRSKKAIAVSDVLELPKSCAGA